MKDSARKAMYAKHGRTPSGGYYPEDLTTPDGRKQMILNYFDKNPTKSFDPFSSIPDSVLDANNLHGNDFELDAMSLRTRGALKSGSGLRFKLKDKNFKLNNEN
jgi:hypothetical protein